MTTEDEAKVKQLYNKANDEADASNGKWPAKARRLKNNQ